MRVILFSLQNIRLSRQRLINYRESALRLLLPSGREYVNFIGVGPLPAQNFREDQRGEGYEPNNGTPS